VRVFRPPTFVDKAETVAEGGSADFHDALTGVRLIPCQGSLIVRKPNNRAVVQLHRRS
jgi:hypothetical protein